MNTPIRHKPAPTQLGQYEALETSDRAQMAAKRRPSASGRHQQGRTPGLGIRRMTAAVPSPSASM
ncbi:hypothetical protein [uncultured Xylophilus sp.]|uniref:hypothetical protein n=1 Tax=uncultured Xylophilus sp. TaxID=296832 RepID=UPI0025DADDBE|nr:hypothetical protein [uncultured Xylophilus sp.]